MKRGAGMEIIHLLEDDDLAAVRERLNRAANGRVLLVLPWDARFLSDALDVDLVRREAERLGLEVAVVSEDPDRRVLIRGGGLPAFASVERAQEARRWPRPERPPLEPPPSAWWEEPLPILPPPARVLPPWVQHARLGARLLVFLATLFLLLAAAYIIVPQATITLLPTDQTVSLIVPVSASRDSESVDTEARLIPARRVGDYFEGNIEVETTGSAPYQSGRASGTVLFANLLGQDVTVPVGTLLRTSAASFPVRFVTTQEVVVPAFGQAPAPVEALEDGPVGNVGANLINQVEGVAGLALRVTNPEPMRGGSTQDVRAISQEDMDRARELLTEQLLGEAYQALQGYLEPTEFMSQASLTVQSSSASYNRFLNERADRLGLYMQLLITGEAIDRDNAETVAYAALLQRLPDGYTLIESDFEIGEMAEEPQANGEFTFYVTATGRAVAEIDPAAVRQTVRGRSLAEAQARLGAEFPLAAPPVIRIWPDWLRRLPVLPLRIDVQVAPER